MKKNKGPLIYKIVRIITLAVPLPIYLFLSATLFNITPDYKIDNVEISDLSVLKLEDEYFVYSTNRHATYTGEVSYLGGVNIHGLTIDGDDIIKIGRGYYSYIEEEFKDIKKLEVQKQIGYKLPMAFFISLFGVMVVALIVTKKLSWHKEHPKGAVLIALSTGTITLYIMDAIIGGILNVFLIATISWGMFMLEEIIYNSNNAEDINKSSDLLKDLKKALKE